MLIYYMIFRCSIPIWDGHRYRLSIKKNMEKSSVVAFRGWIRFCMEILYLGYGHPFASDFCRALQRYLGTEFLPIAMKNILLDTHGLWHKFCLLVLEVIACYNPLTSSWNHHSSSILDGCWCLNRVHSLCLMGKHGQTTMFQHVEGFNIFN